MGTASSVISEKSISGNIVDFSSDEFRPCELCKKELKLYFCDVCKKNLCTNCCEHLAKRTNPFYFSSLVPVEIDSLHAESNEVRTQSVRCGTIGRDGTPLLLSQICYKDNTFEWQLCYLHGRKFCVSKRQPNENKSFAFPGDVCFDEKKGTIHVAIPCNKMIYKLKHLEDFKEAFKTPLGACFGITTFNNGLALSVQTSGTFLKSQWQIQYVDTKGEVTRRIQNNSDGQAYFEEPLNIASNKDGNILFVCDKGKSSVFAFDIKGSLLFHYHGITERFSTGLASDKFDNVYVACGKKIVQIEKGGETSRDLGLDINDNIASVCMAPNSDKLTVISVSGHIASFDIEIS